MAEGVYKRGGKYVVVVSLGKNPGTGKYRQKWVSGFKTAAEARAFRDKARGDKNRLRVLDTKLTVGEYLDKWLQGKASELEPTTRVSYEGSIDLHLKPALGTIHLKDLSADDVRGFRENKLAQTKKGGGTYAAKSVKYYLRILRQALAQAVEDRFLPWNPASGVKGPKVPRKEVQVLDSEQRRLFFAEAKRSSKYYRLYLLALATGARQGELLGLRWGDVNLPLGEISIQQTLYQLDGDRKKGRPSQLLIRSTKTETGRRSVPLFPKAVVEELRTLKVEQTAWREQMGDQYQDHDLVFCQPTGKPLIASNLVKRDFKRILRQAKLPEIRFHDLRHSCATYLFEHNVHPKIVQEILGHKNIKTTLDTYSHKVPGLHRKVLGELGDVALFGGGVSDS